MNVADLREQSELLKSLGEKLAEMSLYCKQTARRLDEQIADLEGLMGSDLPIPHVMGGGDPLRDVPEEETTGKGGESIWG